MIIPISRARMTAETHWSTELAGVLHLAGRFAEVPVADQTDEAFG
ncbi:MAG: hypothetical protein WBA97_38340 [Actinophytocola sp.]